MTRALTHFFGSTDGYRTLARAPGVTDAEDAALASLGFGSPRSQADFDALASQPCMAGRVLPSGRFAITRVFAGEPDVAGRQTVERRTLIVDARAWADLLACDLAATLAQESNWSRERFAAGEAIEVELLPSEELLPEPGDDERRVFDALLEAHGTGRCATLPNDPRWNRALLRLGGFLPPDRAIGFGWGVGMWAVPPGVWLATLRPDAQPRNNFAARLTGAFMHAEQVAQLGRDEAGQRTRRRKTAKGELRSRVPRPWLIGLVVALVLIVIALWMALSGKPVAEPVVAKQADSTSSAMSAVPNGRSAPTETPVPSSEVPETAPANQAKPDATPSAAATSTTAETHPPDAAKQTDAPKQSDAPAQPNNFGSAAHAKDFSSGPVENAVTPVTPKAPTPVPAVSTAPDANPKAPPPPPPAIPAPPTESTPWDAEVALLQKSIDTADRTKTFAAKGEPDMDGAIKHAQQLVDLSDQIDKEARNLEPSLRALFGNGSERRIFLADQAQRGTTVIEAGASKSFLDKIASGMVPADLARQIALLAARFELAQAARKLLKSPLGSTERVRKILKNEETSDGWPAAPPYTSWMQHKDRDGISSREAETFMADAFANKLAGIKGMSGLVKQLRRIAPAPPSTPSTP